MTTLTDIQIFLGFLLGIGVTLATGFVVWLACRPDRRALPRPTARHRRGQMYYDRDEDDETPSPIPAGVFGFAPTEPRGNPNWNRFLTEPLPEVTR